MSNLQGITVTRLNTPAEILNQKIAWDDWCEQSAHPSIFCTADWLSTWWEVFGSSTHSWILQIADGNGKTIGYAPLMSIVRKSLPGLSLRSIEFIGTGERVCPEYLDVIAAPGKTGIVRDAVCKYMADHGQQWDRLWLADGLAGNSLPHLVTQRAWPGHNTLLIPASICPYMNLASTWDEFMAGRSAHMRRTIRQISHRIERELAVSWRVFQTGDDPEKALSVMTRLHTRARRRKGETGNFVDEQYRRFHQNMIIRAADSRRLYLAFLELNRQPAAFYYGFLFGGCMFNYQTGFDPAFGRYRPGWYALQLMTRDLIARGCKRVDFLRGDHDYKWHWANNWHETVIGAVFSPTLAGRLGELASGLATMVGGQRSSVSGPPRFILNRKRVDSTDE